MNKVTVEITENPKILKFVSQHNLLEGALELDRTSEVSDTSVFGKLFSHAFITRIFVTANFIAVAKDDTVEWSDVLEELKNTVESVLLEHSEAKHPKKKEAYSLYSEMTPNPSVMKFVSDKLLLHGSLEVKSKEDAKEIPLASAIYAGFGFVREVFISGNFVAVTKNDEVQWDEIVSAMRSFILEYLRNGGRISNIAADLNDSPSEKTREYTEVEEKINNILLEYVSPAVEGDGGKISLIEYEESSKTAKMLLQGACSGCPSSTLTLKNGIENILKQFLPGVVENVESVNA